MPHDVAEAARQSGPEVTCATVQFGFEAAAPHGIGRGGVGAEGIVDAGPEVVDDGFRIVGAVVLTRAVPERKPVDAERDAAVRVADEDGAFVSDGDGGG